MTIKDGEKVAKDQELCFWDPYNAVILTESDGKIKYDMIEENLTYREISDEQTGHREKVIIDSKG